MFVLLHNPFFGLVLTYHNTDLSRLRGCCSLARNVKILVTHRLVSNYPLFVNLFLSVLMHWLIENSVQKKIYIYIKSLYIRQTLEYNAFLLDDLVIRLINASLLFVLYCFSVDLNVFVL